MRGAVGIGWGLNGGPFYGPGESLEDVRAPYDQFAHMAPETIEVNGETVPLGDVFPEFAARRSEIAGDPSLLSASDPHADLS